MRDTRRFDEPVCPCCQDAEMDCGVSVLVFSSHSVVQLSAAFVTYKYGDASVW